MLHVHGVEVTVNVVVQNESRLKAKYGYQSRLRNEEEVKTPVPREAKEQTRKEQGGPNEEELDAGEVDVGLNRFHSSNGNLFRF
jgi:hypothetical protein